MRKFFIFFTLLLAAFVLSNFIFLFLVLRIDWNFEKTRESYQFKNQQYKVLVFGNSTAMDGINTELISDRLGQAYNFSLGGASLETNYLQLQQYLEKNAKPERVLLFLSSSHINYPKESDLHPAVEYYYTNATSFLSITDIPLFKYRWLFVENLKRLLSYSHRSAQVIKGQLRIKRIITDNTSKKVGPDSCFTNDFYLNPGYESMWKMIDLCHKKEIAIEIFEMPCWKEFQNNCRDVVISKKENGSEYSLPIYNLNERTECDTLLDSKKDWLSKNHLNYDGSVKLTGEIIRQLTALPIPAQNK